MARRLIRWSAYGIGLSFVVMFSLLGIAVWTASLQVKGQGLPACCRLPLESRGSGAASVDQSIRYRDLDTGEVRTLDRFPSMVVFFATWCTTCVEEAPVLERLAKNGVGVLLLNATDNLEDVRRWVGANAPTLAAGVAVDGELAVQNFSVASLPTIVLLDGKGREVHRWRGPTGYDTLYRAWRQVQSSE